MLVFHVLGVSHLLYFLNHLILCFGWFLWFMVVFNSSCTIGTSCRFNNVRVEHLEVVVSLCMQILGVSCVYVLYWVVCRVLWVWSLSVKSHYANKYSLALYMDTVFQGNKYSIVGYTISGNFGVCDNCL